MGFPSRAQSRLCNLPHWKRLQKRRTRTWQMVLGFAFKALTCFWLDCLLSEKLGNHFWVKQEKSINYGFQPVACTYTLLMNPFKNLFQFIIRFDICPNDQHAAVKRTIVCPPERSTNFGQKRVDRTWVWGIIVGGFVCLLSILMSSDPHDEV